MSQSGGLFYVAPGESPFSPGVIPSGRGNPRPDADVRRLEGWLESLRDGREWCGFREGCYSWGSLPGDDPCYPRGHPAARLPCPDCRGSGLGRFAACDDCGGVGARGPCVQDTGDDCPTCEGNGWRIVPIAERVGATVER